jgi:hypothetical protein
MRPDLFRKHIPRIIYRYIKFTRTVIVVIIICTLTHRSICITSFGSRRDRFICRNGIIIVFACVWPFNKCLMRTFFFFTQENYRTGAYTIILYYTYVRIMYSILLYFMISILSSGKIITIINVPNRSIINNY